MGAYFLLYPRAKIRTLFPIIIFFYFVVVPAPLFLIVWFLIQFFQGTLTVSPVETGGVAWWAHIGGFVVGFALAAFMLLTGQLRPPVRNLITRLY